MRKRLCFGIAGIWAGLAGMAPPAHAEAPGTRTFEEARGSFSRIQARQDDEKAWRPMDGVTVTPVAAVTVGRDTNPDELFTGARTTTYEVIDGALLATIGTPDLGLALVGRGSYIHFDDLSRDERYNAGGLVDFHVGKKDAERLNIGGFYLYDTIDATTSERSAGYYEYVRKDDRLELFARGRAYGVSYTPNLDSAGSPFAFDRRFDYNRFEQSGGVMLVPKQRIAPYVEGGYASIDYIHQTDERIFDRDAQEVWGVAGVRVSLSEQVKLDVGARANHRDSETARVGSFDSAFPDIKLTYTPFWTAQQTMYLLVQLDRKIDEPWTIPAVMADVTAFVVQTDFRQELGWGLKLRAAAERNRQIGDVIAYRVVRVEGEVSYEVEKDLQLYAEALFAHLKQEDSDQSYDRFRVGVGLRRRF